MNKRVFLASVFSLFFLLTLNLLAAAGNVSSAYECVLTNVETNNCGSSQLNLEAKIFSLLAVKQCKAQVLSAGSNDECWPKPESDCNIKTTAQAILALDQVGFDTSDAEQWLLSKKMVPSGMTWYLQTESSEETSCAITFDSGSYSFTIGEDKKITTASGSCFSKAQDDYWLKIAPSCYEQEFDVSCDSNFQTNLIYQQDGSSVFFISKDTSTAASEGTTNEKIESFCFKQGNACSYEGTLWATMALSYLENDEADSFIPYLMTLAEANSQYLPDAFLYYLTGYQDYRYSILGDHISNKYWQASSSNNRYYDTAVALLPFVDDGPQEKTESKTWLLSVQGANGCWNNNVKDTAFLLYSVWPEDSPDAPECYSQADCPGEKCLFGQCVPTTADCVEDRHCTEGVCVDYECVDCRYDDECSENSVNKICSLDNTCVECVYETDCDEGKTCSDDNFCVNCETDDECNPGETCVDGLCVGEGDECTDTTEETDCAGDDVCHDGFCVECEINGDCTENGYECSQNNTCVRTSGGEGGDDLPDCEDNDYFCRSSSACITDGGNVIDGYECSNSIHICCSEEEEQETCADLSGETCSSGQSCVGGTEISTSDLDYGETCCTAGGNCETATTLSECEFAGGTCRYSCNSDEDEISDACDFSDEVCCVSGGGGGGNLLWVWILLALIVLIVIGILFREKLRMFFLRLKSRGKGPGSEQPRRPGFPPPSTSMTMMRRPIPRRILPHPQPRPVVRPAPQPKQKPSGELDDVLKKLKEIGK